MIGLICQRTQLKIYLMVWTAVTVDDRSPLAFIDHGVKLNAEYYRLKDSIEALGRQTFRPQTMDIQTGLNTTVLNTRQARMA